VFWDFMENSGDRGRDEENIETGQISHIQYILLKNEGQKDKAGPFQGWVSTVEGHKERVKVGEYGGIFCLHV
jgi:hypothetical protein